jgi:hypothetical protein
MPTGRQNAASDKAEEPAQIIALGTKNDVAADPRMIAFVRLLARQAARDYHDENRRDGEPRGD